MNKGANGLLSINCLISSILEMEAYEHKVLPSHDPCHSEFTLIITGAIAAFGDFTEGLLEFGIDQINCTGSEDNITACVLGLDFLPTCQVHDDAGVLCQSE